MTQSRGLLARIGLDRPELRAWALYDWANSAMMVVVVTAIFPSFFPRVPGADLAPADATLRFTNATTIALAAIAILSPILGAVADFAAVKKRMLALFVALGVSATAALFFLRHGDWLLALSLFALANVGVNGAFVFYDSLLPHIARKEEFDRVSTAGYALGYLGGGLFLALALVGILKPGLFGLPTGEGLSPSDRTLPVRLSFVAVAVWWAIFSIPLLRRVPEPPLTREPDEQNARRHILRAAFGRLGETFRSLRAYKQAFLLLLASLVYSDGINTIIRLSAIYATELGIAETAQIGAFLLVQFVGIPFAFLFGAIASRIGAKRAILIGLAVYALTSVLGYFMRTATHFYILAGLVATVQGGTQALSRSLFASMIPRHKSGEFFGFYAVFERFGAILGPLLFGLVLATTGSSRNAILSIVAFFVVGALLLLRVNIAQGQHAAREADAEVREVALQTP